MIRKKKVKETNVVRVAMSEKYWHVLDEYVVVINERLHRRGKPPVPPARVLGAILSDFFLAHHEEILSESSIAHVTRLKRQVRGLVDPTTASPLSEVPGDRGPSDFRPGTNTTPDD